MSERMSDERFALMQKSYASGNSLLVSWEHFVAERAKVRELEAEVARLKAKPTWKTCDIHGDGNAFTWGCPECVREARAALARVRELPEEWKQGSPLHYDLQRCIDDLEEKLQEPEQCQYSL
jgi:hypothetical protein